MKIFFSTPFSSRVDENGLVFEDYKNVMQDLIRRVSEMGHEYFLSLEYAGWKVGGQMMTRLRSFVMTCRR